MLRTAVILFALLLVPAIVAADDIPDSTEAKVVKVESGEVLVVKLADSGKQVKVRVLGIDCNKKARSEANSMVSRKTVRLRSDKGFLPILQDQYGRYVAYVELANGDDFAFRMIEAGQCSTDQWKVPHPRGAEYASASR